MSYIYPLESFKSSNLKLIGGKAISLLKLEREGFLIPRSFVITTDAYEEFVEQNRLKGLLQLELFRKDLNNCRWEELWDISLRIKNAFLKAKVNENLLSEVNRFFSSHPNIVQFVARSSSTVEDSLKSSFAGLHDSYLGITNAQQLVQKIKLIWASLWSDSALSYRKELGLNIKKSSMAILIQTMIDGRCSGIAFSQSPYDANQSIVEAVYGINQGLVDGKIEPDRWILQKNDFKVVKFVASERKAKMVRGVQQPRIEETEQYEISNPPLSVDDLREVCSLFSRAERYYKIPQDVEWTFRDNELYLLQSRPITVKKTIDPKENRKEWDLSLKRSFENLLDLRIKIKSYLKQMSEQAKSLRSKDIKKYSDSQLQVEESIVDERLKHWTNIYWETFIPYAHGMRLFGQIYNEVVCPQDPYEFISLLQKDQNLATKRNNELDRLKLLVNRDEKNIICIKEARLKDIDQPIKDLLSEIISNYALPSTLNDLDPNDKYTIDFFLFLTRQTKCKSVKISSKINKIKKLENDFLNKFSTGKQKDWAIELLELGRDSFLMRDDDNIFLNRFKDAKSRIVKEQVKRLEQKNNSTFNDFSSNDKADSSDETPIKISLIDSVETYNLDNLRIRKRQITGQPASPGYISGTARRINNPSDLFALKEGEIIICDAIGPEMTFAVPISGGIIERRGGMLIHGAIIAREYGIPCVTGVAQATEIIQTGDVLSVDGHLGIVTILNRVG